MSPKMTAYVGSGAVGALYVDGLLDRTGSRPELEARVAELVGLEIRVGDDFLRGTKTEAAPSLAAVDAWLQAREEARAKVEQMRADAAAMLREAARMAEVYR